VILPFWQSCNFDAVFATLKWSVTCGKFSTETAATLLDFGCTLDVYIPQDGHEYDNQKIVGD